MRKRQKMKSQKKPLTPAQLAMAEFMSLPNWREIVTTIKREAKEGKGITLEEYLAQRAHRLKESPQKKAA